MKEEHCILQFAQKHLSISHREIDAKVVQAICDSRLIQQVAKDTDLPDAFVNSLAIHVTAVPDAYAYEDQCGGLPLIPHLSNSEIQSLQFADPCIGEVIKQIKTGESPSSTVRNALSRLPYLLRKRECLEFHDEILYRKRQMGEKTTYQLVLPKKTSV